jgi:hypothetical protein
MPIKEVAGGWLLVVILGWHLHLDQLDRLSQQRGGARFSRDLACAARGAQEGLGCGLHIGVGKLRFERFLHETHPSFRHSKAVVPGPLRTPMMTIFVA